jgi:hypothetical protein
MVVRVMALLVGIACYSALTDLLVAARWGTAWLSTVEGPQIHGNDTDKEINYTAFWKGAMHAAHNSVLSEMKEAPPPAPCPKVYVYDLPWDQVDSIRHSGKFGRSVIKEREEEKVFNGYLYATNQYAFASILQHRLTESKMCRTLDPAQADLFYAPVLPNPKGLREWKETCQAINGTMIQNQLQHLNSTNACRHFFAIGKSPVDVTTCDGWFSNPIPELRPFSRLAYAHSSFVIDSKGGHHYNKNDMTKSLYPNLFSVPYPSSLHFRSQEDVPHFLHSVRPRTSLMSFIGKHNHGDIRVRQAIHRMCNDYNDTEVCDYRDTNAPSVKPKLTAKSKAIFCLEPAGDTPERKSISDSITFGCIPVLFSDLTDDNAPWFWLDWKDRARVLVPRQDFVAGRIDLKKLLQSIPQDLLELMQRTLEEKARKYQYSVDDDQQDGVRVILDNLHRVALDKEQQGVCGYLSNEH